MISKSRNDLNTRNIYDLSREVCTSHLAEPCKIYCTDTEESVIVPWGEAALDGTPCNVGTRDMCIAGICKVSIL